VRHLAAYLRQRAAPPSLRLAPATVSRLAPVGMADRVCVDLASMLAPGEGMLVGSFSRALFLVHSECMESAYINSRPFRVNAGAVRAARGAGGGGRRGGRRRRARSARHCPQLPPLPSTLSVPTALVPYRCPHAGQVHAYIQAPGGRTAYLSELKTGSEVLIADAAGRTRTAVVGRCKIEARPMVRRSSGCASLRRALPCRLGGGLHRQHLNGS
jgi:3-dehydroquinate synthase II